MPPVFYKAPLPVQHKVPKGRIQPLAAPNIHTGKSLITLTPRRIKAESLEKLRFALKRILHRQKERIVDLHATYAVTKNPDGVKMGQGKGRIDHYVARVPAGYPILRLPQLSPLAVKDKPLFQCFSRALGNIPVSCAYRSQQNKFKVDCLQDKTDKRLSYDMVTRKRLLKERLIYTRKELTHALVLYDNMRRGIGVSRVLRAQEENEKWETLANSLSQGSIEVYNDIAEKFRSDLRSCMDKYKELINQDPSLRLEFLEMCDLLGLDPLLHIPDGRSKHSVLSSFYSEIIVHILDVCLQGRSINGGLCEMTKLLNTFPKELRVSENDIDRCIKFCKPFGENSIRTFNIKGKTFILTTPIVMASEHRQLLELAAEKNSGISITDVQECLLWSSEKAISILNYFIQKQIVWVDESSEGTYYWFPCMFHPSNM